MAKIRGIKPETWTDDKFVQLTPLARLMFIGMWNLACDNGHVEDNAVQLKMRLLPMDACNPRELIEEMVALGQVERADGWLKVVNLVEHQKAPDKRFLTLCERCAHDVQVAYMDTDKLPRSPGARRAPAEHPPSTRRVHAGEGDGDGDGDGEGEVSIGATSAAAEPPKPKRAAKRATQRPADFRPSQAHIDLAAERGIDLHAEWAKFCNYCDANGKTYKNWPAALGYWIRNARPVRNAPGQPSRVQQHLALAQQLAAEEQGLPIGELG